MRPRNISHILEYLQCNNTRKISVYLWHLIYQSWQEFSLLVARECINFREISRRPRAISPRNLVDDWRRCWLIRVAEVKGSLGRAPLYRDRKLCPCIQVRQNGSTPSVPPSSPPHDPFSTDAFLCSRDTGKDKNVFEGFSNWRLRHGGSVRWLNLQSGPARHPVETCSTYGIRDRASISFLTLVINLFIMFSEFFTWMYVLTGRMSI